MELIPESLKEEFLERKRIWILIILVSMVISFYIVANFFQLNPVNVYEPPNEYANGLNISLKCTSDSLFFTDSSHIICNLALKSSYSYQIPYAFVILHMRNVNSNTIEFGCSVTIYNISNSSFTNFTECTNSALGQWVPHSLGVYRITIYDVQNNYPVETNRPILETFPNSTFKKDLTIISSGEAYSRQIAVLSLLVVFVAVIVNVPIVVFAIRKFMKEK
jgi:hypothetical protein